MTTEQTQVMPLTELLKDAPKNWGKWGDNDEVGSLNYLDAAQVLRGVSAARQGKVFTLQVYSPQLPIRAGAHCKLGTVSVTIFGFFPLTALIYLLEARWPSR